MTSVSPGVVGYFLDGRHPGRWSAGAERLLDLSGPVQARDLRRLLQGSHPATGAFLPRVRPHRRRAGWDLMFAAPKSLSLLAATTGRGGEIELAHTAAVAGVLDHLEQGLRLHRKGPDGRGVSSDGMLSAAFEHRENAAGEPHLHTHVLVANLGRAAGEWGAVVGSEWYVGRSGLAALYHLELRGRIQAQGWDLPWRLRPDGLADLAEIPRAAVRAASTQSRLAAVAGRYSARAGATRQPWAERISAAGFPDRLSPTRGAPSSDGPLLASSVGPSSGPDAGGDPFSARDLPSRVSLRLTARRSDFGKWDVVIALAASHPGGATVDQALEWAERFCRDNQAVPSVTEGERWTTPAARRADDELLAALRGRAALGAGAAGAAGAAEARATARSGVVTHLTTGDAGVYFLGAPAGRSHLLAQAELIDSCRGVWEGQGRRVAIATPTAEAATRWAVLAGLSPHRQGDRPDVLVMDRADRRTSPELSRLLAARATTLVFVEGGTMPRLSNAASHGLMELADEVGRHLLPEHATWEAMGAPGRAGQALTGRRAAQALLAEWCTAGDERPLLVGLGVEETRALNRAALALRPGRGVDGTGGGAGTGGTARAAGADGAAGTGGAAGADGDFRPGDRLVVIKGRPGLPPYATFGTVVEREGGGAAGTGRPGSLRPAGGWVRIAWDNGETTQTADRRTLTGVGFGYAVSAHMAGRTDRPLMVLGPADALTRGRERVVHAVQAELDAGDRAHTLDR